MGIMDRTDSIQYEAICFLGNWYVRMNRYGKYLYMTEQYVCDGKPSWTFDMNYATKYEYKKAYKIVNSLKGE